MNSEEDGGLVFEISRPTKVVLVLSPAIGGSIVFAIMAPWIGPKFALFWALVLAIPRAWAAFVRLTAPRPALTREGVRLRPRVFRRAMAVVPWSEIVSLSIVPTRHSQKFLEVLTGNSRKYPGLSKNGLHFIYLWPAVAAPEKVRAAVDRLTGGQFVVSDEPYRRSLVRG